MAIHPKKLEIFEAWYDYEHPAGIDEKIEAKKRRNNLIHELLEAAGHRVDIMNFERQFLGDYIDWQIGEGLKKTSRRRF